MRDVAPHALLNWLPNQLRARPAELLRASWTCYSSDVLREIDAMAREAGTSVAGESRPHNLPPMAAGLFRAELIALRSLVSRSNWCAP